MFMWKHRVLAQASDLEPTPPTLPPSQAQPWCDFVVWTPDELPDGYETVTGTLRKESPPGIPQAETAGRTPWSANNPCAYRFEVRGPGGRVRVKQFLYDWAFPALDHPCLWDSDTRAVAIDDRHVLWFGVDYMKHRGASARLGRTTAELSVLDGEFSDEEILGLYRALRPADPAAAQAIAATPFAQLSYWARRPDAEKINVPIGLWKFRRPTEHHSDWRTGADAERMAGELGLPATLGGLDLDSAGRFAGDDGRTEIEAVYAGGPGRGHELRLIAQRLGRGNLRVPAEPDVHPGTRETLTWQDGTPVQLAWIDERFGPFHAVFARDGIEATLLGSTAVGLDRAWFLRVLKEVLP